MYVVDSTAEGNFRYVYYLNNCVVWINIGLRKIAFNKYDQHSTKNGIDV